MKKIIQLILLLVIFLCGTTVCAKKISIESDIIKDYIGIYGDVLGDGIAAVGTDNIEKMIPDFDLNEILSDLTEGKNVFPIKKIIQNGLSLLFVEIKKILKTLVFIPALAILSSYLINFQSGTTLKGAAQASFFTCYCLIAGISAAVFLEIVGCSKEVIRNISIFMRVLIPVILATIASSGAIISASTLEIVLMSVIEITQWTIEKLFIPLVMMSAALNMANNVSIDLNAEKLVQLINKTVKWGLGILLTLFVGITGLQGIAAGSADGLTVKVTKFAASNLIPMVGGILSETVETVMNCSVVIKNSIGVIGIIVVVIMNVLPILQITACLVVFRICAALIQPFADARCVKCVSELADSVSTVLSISIAVLVMFIIILTIIINIGNTAVLFGR